MAPHMPSCAYHITVATTIKYDKLVYVNLVEPMK